jgi:hypothetical protein
MRAAVVIWVLNHLYPMPPNCGLRADPKYPYRLGILELPIKMRQRTRRTAESVPVRHLLIRPALRFLMGFGRNCGTKPGKMVAPANTLRTGECGSKFHARGCKLS